MASRIQNLVFGLGKNQQAGGAIGTIGSTFLRFLKLDAELTSPDPVFESNAPEIGKGNEFATQTFPSHYNVQNRLEKYASSEFMTWVLSYALGNSVVTGSTAPYTYTITPLNPATTIQLPYFTVVEQMAEGGSNSIDNAYLGCCIEDFVYEFNYGPGRNSSKVTVNWLGSGIITSPSGITVPATLTENNMLAASLTLTADSVNYISSPARILSGKVGWKNNLMGDQGFYPGSGLQNGLQVRGRIETGARSPSFEITARLLATSTEYSLLTSQTTGSAVLSIQHDANNIVTITFPQVAILSVMNTNDNGIVAVKIGFLPEFNTTANNVMSAVCMCGVSGIAQ